MKERVVEILIYIMGEMQSSKGIADVDLGDLKEKGYTQSEISAAFNWLYDNMRMNETTATREANPAEESRRVLHGIEKQMLSTEAQGYLIQLNELGILNDRDIELVIERVMMSGFERLTPAELQEVVASVLLMKAGNATAFNSATFHNRDTVH
jgi:Smg protein